MHTTISALIASHDDGAKAFGAPDREWMTFAGLRTLSTDVRDSLHSFGIGRGDRVAIVLPNGPEMAAAFVTIAQVNQELPFMYGDAVVEYDFYDLGDDIDSSVEHIANNMRIVRGNIVLLGS